MLQKTVILASFVIIICNCFGDCKKHRASYIKPCSKSAPDFDDCCLQHGKEALPFMLKGDKEYKVPNLTPFVSPLISLDTGSLKVSVRDVHIYGFDTNELKQVKFDLDNKKLTVKILFKVINIIGDFEMNGNILMIPLQGSGKTNLTAVGIDVIYKLNYKMVTVEGDEYFAVDSATADFTCEKFYANFNDLLGSNKQLGDTINAALNENWREFLESIKPVITQTIAEIGNSIINGFGGTVPFDEVFLD